MSPARDRFVSRAALVLVFPLLVAWPASFWRATSYRVGRHTQYYFDLDYGRFSFGKRQSWRGGDDVVASTFSEFTFHQPYNDSYNTPCVLGVPMPLCLFECGFARDIFTTWGFTAHNREFSGGDGWEGAEVYSGLLCPLIIFLLLARPTIFAILKTKPCPEEETSGAVNG